MQLVLSLGKCQEHFRIAHDGLGLLDAIVGKLCVHKLDGYGSHHAIAAALVGPVLGVIFAQYGLLAHIVVLEGVIEVPAHAILLPSRKIMVVVATDVAAPSVVVTPLEVTGQDFRHIVVV